MTKYYKEVECKTCDGKGRMIKKLKLMVTRVCGETKNWFGRHQSYEYEKVPVKEVFMPSEVAQKFGEIEDKINEIIEVLNDR